MRLRSVMPRAATAWIAPRPRADERARARRRALRAHATERALAAWPSVRLHGVIRPAVKKSLTVLTPEQNERVTRVGPRTPMGEVFRRYWIPAALSSELPE